jgi:hypothetical protein
MRAPSVVWVGPCCWNDNIWNILQRPQFVIVRLPLLHRLSAHRCTSPQLAPATVASGGSWEIHNMQFAGWYLKIAAVGASIGAAMELFMIHTGFCMSLTLPAQFLVFL